MKTRFMILLAAVSLSGYATSQANASVSVAEDGGGGVTWDCIATDAANHKVIYGTGDEGTTWYRCVHKDWTFDDVALMWGRYYWLHNGAWPFYHYMNFNAWEPAN